MLVLKKKKKCISFSHTQAEAISDWKISHWKMPEPKFIVALGRVAGRNLTWVLFSTNFSLKSSHRRFKAVEKKKSKGILFPAEALQLLDRCGYSSCAKKLWAPGGWDSPEITPSHGIANTAPGFLFWEARNRAQLSSYPGATSPSCLQSKSNHIWLQAKFRKLDYLSPPTRWEMAGWGERGGRSEKLTQALKMLWNCNMHL